MSDKHYHIGLNQEMIREAKFAILPGDPGRVPVIAQQIDPDAKFLVQNREYTSWLCSITTDDGGIIPVLVISTGIGCPSTAICVEELKEIGVDTFFRIGTAGSLQREVKNGSVTIVTGTVRDEGTSKKTCP